MFFTLKDLCNHFQHLYQTHKLARLKQRRGNAISAERTTSRGKHPDNKEYCAVTPHTCAHHNNSCLEQHATARPCALYIYLSLGSVYVYTHYTPRGHTTSPQHPVNITKPPITDVLVIVQRSYYGPSCGQTYGMCGGFLSEY